MADINDRIKSLRSVMKQNNIDTYILTKFDPHQSEDAGEYYNQVLYFSGFTGSNGKLVITEDKCYIFTDGRYYQQAILETEKNDFILMRESDKDTLPFLLFALDITPENGKIGFCAKTLSVDTLSKFLIKKDEKHISLFTDSSVISSVNTTRAFPPTKEIYELDVKYAGTSRSEKINIVRAKMKDRKANCYILSSLDDIAYILNLRGYDVPYNTYFASYLIFEENKTTLFVDSKKIANVKNILENDNITVLDYEEISNYISKLDKGLKTIINVTKTCFEIYNTGSHLDFIKEDSDITSNMKCIKNDTEIENIKNATLRDTVALLKAVRRIKKDCKNLTEHSVSEILYEERAKDDLFICESFHPICGYNENASIIHYHATKESHSNLNDNGLFLIDSGATYFDGTTDMTRTIVLGDITKEMRDDFTLVLKSHIAIATSKFVKGVTGSKIDSFSRAPLWENGRNFDHGTGHGLAFVGPVHEGPQSMGFKDNGVMLDINMLLTNEPGLYVVGKHGIRTENTVRVIPYMTTDDGEFLQFETLSYFPIDRKAINKDLLNQKEIDWINNYHSTVFSKLSKFVTSEDLDFLREETKEI